SSNGHGGGHAHGNGHDDAPVDPVEAAAMRLGRRLFDFADFHEPAPWTPAALHERFLQKFIADEAVKMSALKFVDVFPAIANDTEGICAHVREYFGEMLREAAAGGAKKGSSPAIQKIMSEGSR